MTASFRSKSTARPIAIVLSLMFAGACLGAQAPVTQPAAPRGATPDVSRDADPDVPPGYVIGPDDVLTIVYWKDPDMTSDVQVRPDGKVGLPLLNDVVAAGLTPDELRESLTDESRRFMEDPSITVVVRQINSRKVYITGEVGNPGPYPLTAPISVMQLIAMAGGLREYANEKRIIIMRTVDGRPTSLRFNYRDVVSGKNLQQNIALLPGDTVVVP